MVEIELAKEFGVAANITFPLPATFIWDMFTQVLTDVPQHDAFNKGDDLEVNATLPQLLNNAEFSALKHYLQGDDDQEQLYQLAEKIADIYDGYAYDEWIASWGGTRGAGVTKGEHNWRPILWRALYEHTTSLGQSPYHRANLYQDFISRLENSTHHFEQLPKRLFVFGITSLPPRYMDALKAMGDIDVHLMFTNPCRYYWGEVRDRKYLARLAARHRQHLVWKEDHSELEGEASA